MLKHILSIYTGAFVLFCIFSYLFIDANFYFLSDLYTGFSINQRIACTVVYVALVIIMFFLYMRILKLVDSTNIKQFEKYKFLILIPIVGFLAYPAILSFDMFNYLATAKVTFGYLENPYIVMPNEFIGEPTLVFTRATNKIALYGPLWTILSGIPYYLSLGNYLLSVVLFKLLVGIFFSGILWMIWRITKNVYSVAFFALSPLVLIETFVSGHNDVVMMFFAIGSLYFLKSKKVFFGISFLVLSILIKYATIFLLPVVVYVMYKQIKNKDINWDYVYLLSFISMIVIFFLSPLREEIYPWYAIWPLTFLSLIARRYRMLSMIFTFFTFCLMLRYIPFMALGTYFGPTPYINIFFTFGLPIIFLLYLFSTNKIKFNK